MHTKWQHVYWKTAKEEHRDRWRKMNEKAKGGRTSKQGAEWMAAKLPVRTGNELLKID